MHSKLANLKIVLNCYLGESYGNFTIGNDIAIFPYISSCNIACGFHGGDPLTLQKTIKAALAQGLRLGAHPAYPDLQGFGRRQMDLSSNELEATIRYQVAALKGMIESLGGKLAYVKPHGALYNKMANNADESRTVIQTIQSIDPDLQLMGLAGSTTQTVAKEMGISFIAEAFADRRYTKQGKLVSRSVKGAVINDPELVFKQVQMIVNEGLVESLDGTIIPISAQSICIHGDNPKAIAILEKLNQR